MEEEKISVTPEETPQQEETPTEAVAPEETQVPEVSADLEESTDSTEPQSNSSVDKISAIRDSMWKLELEEEQQQTEERVASRIARVKDKKEHPKEYAARQKKRRRRNKLMSIFPNRYDSAGEKVRKSVFLLSISVFVVCAVLFVLYLLDLYQSRQVYDELGENYHHWVGEDGVSVATSVTRDDREVYSLLPGVEDLLDINPEIVGWITIDNTNVDYPVLQHEEDKEGEEYYLYRNVLQKDSKPGSIFMDSRCSFDSCDSVGFLEEPNSDNLIIYGHNMRDLSMFGTLKYYKTEEDYYEQHPLITLSSNYKTYTYKIFAYYVADADDTTDTRFEYWNGINFSTEDEFYDYVNEIKRRTLRLTNVDVTYGDQLLTLSTCNNVFDSARLVVVARLVREGEDPYEGTTDSVANPNIKWPSVYYVHNKNTYDPNGAFTPYGPSESE